MALQCLVTTTWTLWCTQIVSRGGREGKGGEGRGVVSAPATPPIEMDGECPGA